ncbi:hypothetical protein HB777_26170 [Mesorhizobium loti]|nr:hypothetical protein HB777_26170 [Mesorhizobium loti]
MRILQYCYGKGFSIIYTTPVEQFIASVYWRGGILQCQIYIIVLFFNKMGLDSTQSGAPKSSPLQISAT